MTKRIFTIALIAAFSFAVQTAFATDATEKSVEKLMKVMKMKENVDKSLNNVMTMLPMRLRQNPELIEKIKTFYKKNVGWEAQKDGIVQIYKELFTEKEIQDQIAFYETPTGKKMIDLTPVIQQKVMQMGMTRMQKAMPELQKIIMEAMRKSNAPKN
jgi:hypothetical protein